MNIDDVFTAKTASHIQVLQEVLGMARAFGRSDVQRVLGLKPTRSSALLREMAEHGIIDPVSGHGKGKYRFRHCLASCENRLFAVACKAIVKLCR
ncbi:hypothetical protein [Arcanobacterium hippocoleae]|uniref:Transcriptional regulator n=1 Tax=Arcanobacterium hippocoleae TaxID=149017 RepID=A0ABU1T2L5_9ACTO|nr:hypothetical protein [Arcanobacterium hippocoleae]